jgi:hypothetical protein
MLPSDYSGYSYAIVTRLEKEIPPTIFSTSDHGITWYPVMGKPPGIVAADHHDALRFYGVSDGSFYDGVMEDGSPRFIGQYDSGLDGKNSARDLTVSPTTGKFYLLTASLEIQVSEDGGASWKVHSAIPELSPNRERINPKIRINHTDPQEFFVVSGDGEAWMYRDSP